MTNNDLFVFYHYTEIIFSGDGRDGDVSNVLHIEKIAMMITTAAIESDKYHWA